MRTEYCFTVDGAELVYVRQAQGTQVITINHRYEYGKQQLCSCWVDEGDLAERAFFNWFGDDSSWPPGWYKRVTEGRFTKLRTRPMEFTRDSWTKENYPESKVSWQEYFGVRCPSWYV